MSHRDYLIAEGSPKFTRAGEGPKWTLDTTKWGSSPTDVIVTAKNSITGADATDDVLSGDPAVNGNVITLPKFSSATAGHFRLIVQFTVASYEPAMPAIDVIVEE